MNLCFPMALRSLFLLCLAGHSTAWLLGGFAPAPRSAVQRAASASMAAKAVNVAIVGGGTVGGGIVEILSGKATFLRDQLGVEAKISKICVRDASRQRDFAVPDGCKIVTDVNEILDDAAVEMVVEVMGGTDLAKTVVTKALKAGKHVVTANKALIAQVRSSARRTLGTQQQRGSKPPSLWCRLRPVRRGGVAGPAGAQGTDRERERRSRDARELRLRGRGLRRDPDHSRAPGEIPPSPPRMPRPRHASCRPPWRLLLVHRRPPPPRSEISWAMRSRSSPGSSTAAPTSC